MMYRHARKRNLSSVNGHIFSSFFEALFNQKQEAKGYSIGELIQILIGGRAGDQVVERSTHVLSLMECVRSDDDVE